MPLSRDLFIKTGLPFQPEFSLIEPAPMFRRRFTLKPVQSARLSFCALGIGYIWINGRKVTEDLLSAPVSNYDKTLWYYEYDVTSLLQDGENVLAAMLGNGLYNETFPTSWDFDQAAWRDQPKLALCLEADGQTVLVSDEEFLCTKKFSPMLIFIQSPPVARSVFIHIIASPRPINHVLSVESNPTAARAGYP